MTEEARAARASRSLLKTEGNAYVSDPILFEMGLLISCSKDCAAAVRFLAGDESRWITGMIMPVDAGATCAVGIELGSLSGQ